MDAPTVLVSEDVEACRLTFENEADNTGTDRSLKWTSVPKEVPKHHSLFLCSLFHCSLRLSEGSSPAGSMQHTDTGIKVFSQAYSLGSAA